MTTTVDNTACGDPASPTTQACPANIFADAIARLAAHDADAAQEISARYLAAAAPSPRVSEQADDPVVEANRQLLLDRSRVGIAKYGVTLASAGLSRAQLAQHALEEALDLANYLQTILQSDRDSPAQQAAPAATWPTNDEVYAEVRRQRGALPGYVSTNAVNDVMQAVRSLLASQAATTASASGEKA